MQRTMAQLQTELRVAKVYRDRAQSNGEHSLVASIDLTIDRIERQLKWVIADHKRVLVKLFG